MSPRRVAPALFEFFRLVSHLIPRQKRYIMRLARTGMYGVAALVVVLATVSTGRAAEDVASVTGHHAAAIPGWPPRGPVNDITCPGIRVCYADGDVGVPARLPATPPT